MSLDYNIEVTDEEADDLCKQVYDSLTKNYEKSEVKKEWRENAGELLNVMNNAILSELYNRVEESSGVGNISTSGFFTYISKSSKNKTGEVPYWINKNSKKSW